jgi:hypothetical protein
MSRFLGALVFVSALLAADSASAKKPGPPSRSVPELNVAGSAAGLALIVGAGAIVFGRRRARKS